MATVREATPGDVGAIRDVQVASIRGRAASRYDAGQIASWSDLEEDDYSLPAEGSHVVVAEADAAAVTEDRADDPIVGFGAVDLESGEVRAVYVHPDHAGEGVDVGGIGPGAEGASYVTMLPRERSEFDTPGNRHLREVAGVAGTDEVLVGGHYFVSYEALSWIADAVEATGWSSDEDHRAFLRWFEEGPSVEGGEAYPQGPKFFRGTDHQAFMNTFVEEVRDGSLRVVREAEVTEPTFPPAADLAGQPF